MCGVSQNEKMCYQTEKRHLSAKYRHFNHLVIIINFGMKCKNPRIFAKWYKFQKFKASQNGKEMQIFRHKSQYQSLKLEFLGRN